MQPKKIKITISGIKKNYFFEVSLDNNGFKNADLTKLSFNLNVNYNIDEKQKILTIKTSVTFFIKKENEKKDLIGIETLFSYNISNFHEIIEVKDGKYKVPNRLMYILLDKTISGTRGMLAGLKSLPEYQKIILPFVDINKLIDTLNK